MSGRGERTIVRHRYVRRAEACKGKLWDALHYMQQRPLGEDEQPSRSPALHGPHRRACPLMRPGRCSWSMRPAGGLPSADPLSRRAGRGSAALDAVGAGRPGAGTSARTCTGWRLIHRNTAHPHVPCAAGGHRGRAAWWRPAIAGLPAAAMSMRVLREAGDRHGARYGSRGPGAGGGGARRSWICSRAWGAPWRTRWLRKGRQPTSTCRAPQERSGRARPRCHAGTLARKE